MSSKRLIAIIGGTGAQGAPVVRELLQSGQYSVRVLTRDMSRPRFQELLAYGPVEGVEGTFASEDTLHAMMKGAWGAFVNIDGFNSGEKAEIFWTMRGKPVLLFHSLGFAKEIRVFWHLLSGFTGTIHLASSAWELAIEEGVKFYVHGNIDYAYKKSGFRPEFHCGHYDAKGRVAEWIRAQNKDPIVRSRMRSGVFTTGPYIDMTIAKGTPLPPTIEDGVATWRAPIGQGALTFVALDDVGVYVKWMFDNWDGEADGMDLEVAVAHITFEEYVRAFSKVTGKPAQWIDSDLNSYLDRLWGPGAERPAGYNADPNDPATMTMRRNFTAWFTLWRNCGGDDPVLKRDYALLDRIHPKRLKTAEEWLRHENEKGLRLGLGSLWDRIQPDKLTHLLKVTEDGRKGII
ncbi:hypothetical protein GGS21DRAFT_491318 [Xylaria nigripes]|nr:hypothetical protein GGS21DRAFT_491318 [Xylaria nigripes]